MNKQSYRSKIVCGVPQCRSKRSELISFFRIPRNVREDKMKLKLWSTLLGREFCKHFSICSLHFEPRYILRAPGSKTARLSSAASPTLNLPSSKTDTVAKKTKNINPNDRKNKSSATSPTLNLLSSQTKVTKKKKINSKNTKNRLFAASPTLDLASSKTTEVTKKKNMNDIKNRLQLRNNKKNITKSPEETEKTLPFLFFDQEINMVSVAVQTDAVSMKNMQCQVNQKYKVYVTQNWNTDSNLFTKTGIPSIKILNAMEKSYNMLDNDNSEMTRRDQILMTMHKLKSNCTFSEIAIDFKIHWTTAENIFSKTIQLLAKGMRSLIYWPTREEIRKNSPSCFQTFPNCMVVLDCTELETAKLNCLSCKTSSNLFHTAMHTIKILVGVSPSGLINYISPISCGKKTDEEIFNSTNLLEKLQPGDSVMVDEHFKTGNELSKAGIEVIRSPFLSEIFSEGDVNQNIEAAEAKVYVERRISRIKNFKVLCEKISSSVLPYIDDIMIILSALSNLSNQA